MEALLEIIERGIDILSVPLAWGATLMHSAQRERGPLKGPLVRVLLELLLDGDVLLLDLLLDGDVLLLESVPSAEV